MARRSGSFPVTMGKLREGKLSEDQVRPIVRHAPDGYDESVAQLAEHLTVPQLERTMRRYSFGDDRPPTASQLANSNDDGEDETAEQAKEQKAERARQERQFCSFGHDDDGMWSLKARLTREQGEIVQKALSIFRQDIFNERDGKATWHDALVRMADTALAAHGDTKDRRSHDRYQVLLHMRAEKLDQLTSTELVPPSTYFHLGPAVSQTMAKYMSCDASVRLILERDGRRVSVGRKYRTVPDHTRRVVEDRDGGCCTTPGCGATLGLQVHHIRHWEDGGATDTDNLTAHCGWCHQAIHRGDIVVTGNADVPGGLTFTDRRGRPLATKPKAPEGPLLTGSWTHPTGGTYDPACIHFKKTAA